MSDQVRPDGKSSDRALRRLGLGLLYRHPFIILATLLSLAVAAIVWNADRQQRRLLEIQALSNARLYANMLVELRGVYTAEVIDRLRGAGITVTHDYQDRDHAIPLPATLAMALNERLSAGHGANRSRLYSPYPFPWRAAKGGLRDDFAERAWARLSAEPETDFHRFETLDGQWVLRYAIADRMQSECVTCHNSHPQSPKTDWAVGDVRGVIEIASPIGAVAATLRDSLLQTAVLMILITIVGLSLLWLVVRNLQRVTQHAQSLADEATAAGRQLEELAHYDPLSGLPNRALFQDRLRSALARARRAKEQVALLLLDLDHFKQVNDTLGHAAGDVLLAEVAGRLRGVVRDEDTVARLGGDEFVIIQSGFNSADSPMTLGNRIFDAMAKPALIDGHEIPLGVSIGMTVYPDDASETEQLLKNADLALYRAKDSGRGTAAFYSKLLGESARRRMDLAAGLRAAIDNGELSLLYQPKFSSDGRRLVGAEALIRWQRPDEGPVSPREFIPVAESTGQLARIGDWILGKVCADIQLWNGAGVLPIAISVNLSAVQFRDPTLPERIGTIIAGAAVEAGRLEFELTETALMRDPEFTEKTLSMLTEIGCTVSVDDFGTGYSSMANLKRFPISKLKLDQSFTRELIDSPEDEAMVRGIVSLAHNLNLRTVAEGVENEAQLNRLHEIGCDEVQGYLLSRPISAVDLADLARKLTENPAPIK